MNNAEMELLNLIQNDIRKKEIQQKDIAEKMGVTGPRLSQIFKGEIKNIIFLQFYILICHVYDNDSKKIKEKIEELVKQTTSEITLRSILEWSLQNGEDDIFFMSLQKMYGASYDNETAILYDLSMQRKKQQIKDEVLFEKIEEIKFEGIFLNGKYKQIKKTENKILLNILTLYVHLGCKEYGGIERVSKSILKRVDNLKDKFIRDAYKARVQETLAIALMKNNKIEQARNVAINYLNDIDENLFPYPVNSLLCLLSELYVFDDFQKSKAYINLAINTFNSLGTKKYHRRMNDLESTFDFIHIYHGEFENLYLNDTAEKAHYFAKKGNPKKTETYLQKILSENDSLSAFQLYYRALATKEEKDIKRAEKEFYIRKDFYYIKLIENLRNSTNR